MNRFTFKNYLIEAVTLLTQALSKEEKNYIKDIKKKLKLSSADIKNTLQIELGNTGGTARAYREIIRAPLGLDEETVKNNVKKIFNLALKSDYKILSFGDYGTKLDGGSGTYNSLQINVQDNKTKSNFLVVATTTQRENITLKNKDLVPNKLGVSSDVIYTASALINQIKTSINSIEVADTTKNAIVNLLTDLSSKKDVSAEGSFSGMSTFTKAINNIINSDGEYGEILSTLSKETVNALELLSINDLHSILKDLGEIIQPLMLAQKYKGIKISYPSGANAKLVDFYILHDGIRYEISAKAAAGGVPSGAVYFEKAKEINENNKSFFTEEEQDFINKIGLSFEKSVAGQQIDLVNIFLANDDTGLVENKAKKLFKAINISSWETINDAITNVEEYFKKHPKETKENFFTNLYSGINYNLKKLKDFPVNKLDKIWDSLEDKTKYGVIIYPAWSKVVEILNDNYTELLSSIIQKVSEIYQGHLYYKDSKLRLIIKAGKTSHYMFKTGGISTKNITGAKLGIKLK